MCRLREIGKNCILTVFVIRYNFEIAPISRALFTILFFRNDIFKCRMVPYVYHLQEKELTVSYAFLVLSMNCVLMTCRGWGIMLTGLVRLYHFSLISKHPKGP